MTIYKQPGSPYYYYDFYFEGRRYQKSTHLRNKTIAHRVECVRKAEFAQRRVGILPKKQIPSFRDFAERFLHTITSGGSGPGIQLLMSRKSGYVARKVSKRSFSSGFIEVAGL
jgi:hypothetical protein